MTAAGAVSGIGSRQASINDVVQSRTWRSRGRRELGLRGSDTRRSLFVSSRYSAICSSEIRRPGHRCEPSCSLAIRSYTVDSEHLRIVAVSETVCRWILHGGSIRSVETRLLPQRGQSHGDTAWKNLLLQSPQTKYHGLSGFWGGATVGSFAIGHRRRFHRASRTSLIGSNEIFAHRFSKASLIAKCG